MKGRRGTEEEEELKQRIRALLEEGKTYEEIEKQTGASRHTIAKVKKQMQREEVGHRSPLEEAAHHHTGAQDRGGEEGEGEEEAEEDHEEEAAVLEAIDKAARNTALNEVIAKVKTKAKLEVNDIYQLGLALRDVLQSEAGEEYYREAEKSGLPLGEWVREKLNKALRYHYYFMYSLWEHPDLYRVINWSLDAWKLWHQEWRYQLLKQEYENSTN
jgi:hypothetical protein